MARIWFRTVALVGSTLSASVLLAQPPGYAPAVPPGGVFPPGPGVLPPPVGAAPVPPMVPGPPPGGFGAFNRPGRLGDYAWTSVDIPQPREIKVNDIITILVKEQSETTVDARFNRNRMSNLRAELKEFMRLDDGLNLTSAAEDQPKMDGQLTGRFQTTGTMVEREGMIYRIAATVVDVLPNGNLVLEARKSIRSNRDVWEYELTGQIRAQDVHRDNTALSENIANLAINKTQRGKVYDSTRVPWGTRLYEIFFPF